MLQDNAWTETTAFHFHCGAELGAQLQLGAGDDAGAMMWLDVDMQNARYRDLYGAHRLLVNLVASGMLDTWRTKAWLSSFEVTGHVACSLLGGARPIDELAAMRVLGEVTTSEAALAERLRAGGVAEALAKGILPQLRALVVTDTATATELHDKVRHERFEPPAFRSGMRCPAPLELISEDWAFAPLVLQFVQQGNAFQMKYAGLSTFFGGLEAKIGPPNPDVHRVSAMHSLFLMRDRYILLHLETWVDMTHPRLKDSAGIPES